MNTVISTNATVDAASATNGARMAAGNIQRNAIKCVSVIILRVGLVVSGFSPDKGFKLSRLHLRRNRDRQGRRQ